MSRFRRDSIFGPGPRIALDREQRAQWRARLKLARRPHRLTQTAVAVGEALLSLLGGDGRLDPSIDTLAALAHASRSATIEALNRLRAWGFLDWTRRIVRCGWRVAQTSNAYVLRTPVACESGFHPGVGVVRFKTRDSVPSAAEARRIEQGGWRGRASPCPPVRSVEEQLALLLAG